MAIYGNELNCTEDTVPNPISYYGVSKLSGEYYTKLITEFEKIPYTIFRLFATYGHGQDMTILNQGIVSIYIALSKQSDTISITGKKNRIRQLVHVDDVCNAFELSLKDDTTDGETYNVLFDEEITPEKIITEISNATKKDLKINEVDGYRGDQTKITGKNSKLCSIGWKPMINLKDGVNKFIKGLEDVRTN